MDNNIFKSNIGNANTFMYRLKVCQSTFEDDVPWHISYCNKSVSMLNNSNNLVHDLLGKGSSACPMKLSSCLLM